MTVSQHRSAMPRRRIRRHEGGTIGPLHRPRWNGAAVSEGLELGREAADWRIIRHDDWRDIRHLAPRRFELGQGEHTYGRTPSTRTVIRAAVLQQHLTAWR